MTDWNLANAWEIVTEATPDTPCQIQGERVISWRDFDRRANALAADMLEAGLSKQSKVAAYLYNCPEYLETYYAAFKAGLVPVNTNFRYGPEEVSYLWSNADAEVIVFHATFADTIEKVRDKLTTVKRWYVVSDGAPEPEWAINYETAVSGGADRVVAPWGRSGDDLLFLYTGGTTGMPKGVMWRQDDLFNVLGAGGNVRLEIPPVEKLEELGDRIRAVEGTLGPFLTACPLMHGTGQFSAFGGMFGGRGVVSLASRRFSAAELWQTVQERKVFSMAIVGDAFARPMLQELEANPGQYDLSSLATITSSGVMWSREVKQGLIKQIPQVMLFDSFGSSEAVGLGGSVTTAEETVETAKFMLGETVKVFTDDDRPVEPGSEEIGRVAISGFLPVGYYKDEEKSAKTFRTIDGVRYSMPGDYASVNPDGTLTLLGRGSVCINTGGEKVFPEEVEEVLKRHAAITDAVCVGIPDDRFGETICALVEPAPNAVINDAEVMEFVRGTLAAYKSPRDVLKVDSIGRAPNGKVDYKGLKVLARERLGR